MNTGPETEPANTLLSSDFLRLEETRFVSIQTLRRSLCVVADSEYGKSGPFRKRLRELEESYVVEIYTPRLYVVPEETELLEPGPTPGRGPARKYTSFPKHIEPKTAEEIADQVDREDDWERVEWAEGTKDTLSGLFSRKRVRAVTHVQNRRVEETTGWLLLDSGSQKICK